MTFGGSITRPTPPSRKNHATWERRNFLSRPSEPMTFMTPPRRHTASALDLFCLRNLMNIHIYIYIIHIIYIYVCVCVGRNGLWWIYSIYIYIYQWIVMDLSLMEYDFFMMDTNIRSEMWMKLRHHTTRTRPLEPKAPYSRSVVHWGLAAGPSHISAWPKCYEAPSRPGADDLTGRSWANRAKLGIWWWPGGDVKIYHNR